MTKTEKQQAAVIADLQRKVIWMEDALNDAMKQAQSVRDHYRRINHAQARKIVKLEHKLELAQTFAIAAFTTELLDDHPDTEVNAPEASR